MEYMRGVVSNMYRYCFIKFKDQDSRLVREVLESVHSRYPNPPRATFSDVWERTRIREILSNKRSHVQEFISTRGGNQKARQDRVCGIELLQSEKEEHKKTKAMLLKARRKSTVLGERLRKRKIRNIAELKAGSGS